MNKTTTAATIGCLLVRLTRNDSRYANGQFNAIIWYERVSFNWGIIVTSLQFNSINFIVSDDA